MNVKTHLKSAFFALTVAFLATFVQTSQARGAVIEYLPGLVPPYTVVSTVTIFDSTGPANDGGVKYTINGSPVQGSFNGFNFISGTTYNWSLEHDNFSVEVGANIYSITLLPVPTTDTTLMKVGSVFGGMASADLLSVNAGPVLHSLTSNNGSLSSELWNTLGTPGAQSGKFTFTGDGGFVEIKFIEPVPEMASTPVVFGLAALAGLIAFKRRRRSDQAKGGC